jgi:hypothetical protein
MAIRSVSSACSGGRTQRVCSQSSHLPFVGPRCGSVVLTLAQFLRPGLPDCPVDLPLVVLPGLAEHGQEHDPPISRTPVRDPGRNITKTDPQLPDPRPLLPGDQTKGRPVPALLGDHPAHFVDALEVVITEAIQPVADLWFELKVMQAPYPAAHEWLDYRQAAGCGTHTGMIVTGVPGQQGAGTEKYFAIL